MTTVAVSPALRRFQDAFASALLDLDDGRDDAVTAGLIAQPAFAVYRNTALKGCIDALAANYPAVLRLVGEEWFRDAAAIYARASLPQRPMLHDYGANFPQFLAGFKPAFDLPYLAAVAQLDRFWTEAHVARDEATLDATLLQRLPAAHLSQLALRPHASARWAWYPAMPIRTIWQRNRHEETAALTGELDWHGEGVLIVRPHGRVETASLGTADCGFLDDCAAGRSLLAAAQRAERADGGVDLTRLLARLLSVGAFAAAQCADNDSEREGS